MQLDSIILETDALIVVHAINHYKHCVGYFCMVLDDCVTLLNEISNSSFFFVKRSANQIAHIFARTSVSMSNLGARYIDYPSMIIDGWDFDYE